MQRLFSTLTIFILILLAGCSGGDGASTPTASSPQYILQGNVFIQNRGFQPTLEEVEVTLDGRRVGTFADSNGTGQLNGVLTDLDITPGRHRIGVRILRQRVSRATYWTPGSHIQITDLRTGNRVLDRFLDNQSASLREGQGFDWEFSF